MSDSLQKWRLLRSTPIMANQWLGVRADDCVTGRGVRLDYYVVEKRDAAVAVAITTNDELLLVRQFKPPAGDFVVECPAGYVNDGENPATAVVRELREETGYRAGKVQFLGAWLSSPAVLTNHAHLFLCSEATLEGEPELDQTEDLELLKVDFTKALRQVQAGELVSDLASVAAILLAGKLRQ